ncbi:EAL domain-containing protein [Crassaminicella profunda]|uniref:EAL domain-containing protein n=1 Tax=Crassaminicella profunda TaxID=1286698 RepID=UPI001CA78738|nr:EAL domain-containing protein [Crassaminicella profunda]QZY56106.1 EAL domain-containing protein [Crassaminicella profunda]
MKFQRSIKTKILMMVLIASLTIASVIIFISENMSINTLKNLLGEHEVNSVALYAEIIGGWFEERMDEIEIYANNPFIRDMNWEKIEPYLQEEIKNKLDIYDTFFIADKTGKCKDLLLENSSNIKERAYFKEAMEGKTIVSNPIIANSTGNQVVVVVAPIKSATGEVIGVMGADVNLIKLNYFIKKFKIEHLDSYSYLVTKDGLNITHPDHEKIMKRNSHHVLDEKDMQKKGDLLKILEDSKGYIHTEDAIPSISYFHEVPNTDGWKIITKIPIQYIKQPIRKITKMLFFIGVVGVVLANIVGFIMANKIANPIIQLNQVFRKAAKGDLTVRAEIDSQDEIGRAAKSFNVMMETIRYMTYYDPLTDLPNRGFFGKQLKFALSHAKRNKEKIGVMVIGLDRFKTINDTFGHNIGDQLLRAVAKELKNCVEEEDVVSRIGGGEFTILLPEIWENKNPAKIAQKILFVMNKPWKIDGNEFYISASIGIAYFPDDGVDELTLLKNADTALHRVKEKGGNHYQFYAPSMNENLMEKLDIDKDLHDVLENEELLVYYQPKVDTHTRNIIGMEALVRWKHPKKGMISPATFIPLAEENGCILSIGEWVLHTACKQNKLWQDEGYEPITVAVNISARQFQQPNFVDLVRKVLKETELDPRYLELEITESIAVEDIEYTIEILNQLKEMNIQIAMDDFGTGYSSLSYLKRFAIDHLKIDQSFVKDIISNKNDQAIASTIIAMGNRLNLKVTAEGVETKEQLDFLEKENCQYIQGYLFSKPVPAKEFEKMIKVKKI